MNTKLLVLGALLLAPLASLPCFAQELPVSPTPLGAAPAYTPAADSSSDSLLPSNWIRYSQPDCCNQIGGSGPIKSELYVRSGIWFPMGGGDFPERLNTTGWELQAGARVLFFNCARTGAWTADLGVGYQSISSDTADPIQLNILVPGAAGAAASRQNVDVTMDYLSRTFAYTSVGHEWWLWAPANEAGSKWRAGVDIGGRYGSVKVDFNEIAHRSKEMTGLFAAVHSDWEMPCGACILTAGLRMEWAYTWCNVLQQPPNDGNFSDLGLMLNLGVRF
jgi:hypothetical protein